MSRSETHDPLIEAWLTAILPDKSAQTIWWQSPNRAFDDRTPQEVYDQGTEGPKAIKAYLASRNPCRPD